MGANKMKKLTLIGMMLAFGGVSYAMDGTWIRTNVSTNWSDTDS
jgi:hypothetical protein